MNNIKLTWEKNKDGNLQSETLFENNLCKFTIEEEDNTCGVFVQGCQWFPYFVANNAHHGCTMFYDNVEEAKQKTEEFLNWQIKEYYNVA